ncbi:MAG: UbiA prenyltransferase family protein [Desulfatibacillum sp.]|nr:UbiA prenyltransferase family protein [Desulfatibacillum sp.]
MTFESALGLLSCVFYLAFTFGYNNFYDRHLDEPEKNPLTSGDISLKSAHLLVWGTGLLGWSLSWGLSLHIGFLCTGMFFFSWFYSGPVQGKRVFVLGSLMNCLIFIPIFYAGILVFGKPVPGGTLLCLVLAPSVLIPQLAHEIQDRDSDLAAGINTVAVRLGKEKTIGCIWFLAGLRAALAWACILPGYLAMQDAVLLSLISCSEIGLTHLYKGKPSLATMRLGFRFTNIALGAGLLISWIFIN